MNPTLHLHRFMNEEPSLGCFVIRLEGAKNVRLMLIFKNSFIYIKYITNIGSDTREIRNTFGMNTNIRTKQNNKTYKCDYIST